MTCRQQINQSSAGRRRGLLRLVSSTPKEPGDCGCPLWPKHEPVGGDPREPPAIRVTRKMVAERAEASLTRLSDGSLLEPPIDG